MIAFPFLFAGEVHTASDNNVASLGVNTMSLKTKMAAAAMGVV